MMFKKVDYLPQSGRGTYNTTKNQEFLMSFIASGYRFAEVDAREYKNATSCYTTLKKAINTHGMKESVAVYMRGNKVFIENLLLR